ncbi:hypothetical protein [Coralliovum pocilloporae]|uniref:hypothetical protein n=1 Tax=Coralliovum pocilloporae TaxID=3066369 RepID=UPI003306AD00
MRRSLRSAHKTIWIGFALLIPAIIVTALLVRQTGPLEKAPVLLSPPVAEGAAS